MKCVFVCVPFAHYYAKRVTSIHAAPRRIGALAAEHMHTVLSEPHGDDDDDDKNAEMSYYHIVRSQYFKS